MRKGAAHKQIMGAALALALVLGGCAPGGTSSELASETWADVGSRVLSGLFRERNDGVLTLSSPYEYRAQQPQYEALLTDEARELYHAIGEQANDISEQQHSQGYYTLGEIRLPGKVSEGQIRMAITAFKNDHPQVFWLANVYSKAYSEDETVVRLYSYVSETECREMVAQLNTAVQEVLSELPSDLSEFDREVALFDAIAGRCVYDTKAANDASLWKAYTIYGLFVDGTAVCEGYARAMQLLLRYADMEVQLVYGQAGGVAHMWNLVRVDGDWYHLDPTWNDEESVVRYDYFNVTDAVIGQDHTPSADITTMSLQEIDEYLSSGTASYNLPRPACTSEEYNYLKQRGVLISGFNKATETRVVQALVEAAREKRTAVYLYLDPELNYQMAVNQLFHSSPYQMADYVARANRKLDDDSQLRYDRLTYLLGEHSRAITLKLAYSH